MSAWEQNIYEAGRAARHLSISKRACPHGLTDLCARHWWLAGWGDMDIEMMSEMEEAA